MRYLELSPCRALARFVKCFWVLEAANPANDAPERIVPDGCPELIVHYGDRFVETDRAGRPVLQSQAVLAGQLTGPLLLSPTGRTGMIAARFHPGGLWPILRVPMHELTDQRLALEAVCSHDAAELTCRIGEARSDNARRAAFEAFLLARPALAMPPGALAVERSLAAIDERRGMITLAELATGTHCSPRQLQRLFRESVGISPKLLSRIVRFRAVFDAIGENSTWCSAALGCGYFDQAHLIHDFQCFAGRAPAAYLAAATDFARCFHSS